MLSWLLHDLIGHIFVVTYIWLILKTLQQTCIYYTKFTYSSKSVRQLEGYPFICMDRMLSVQEKLPKWLCYVWQLIMVNWPANNRLNLICRFFSLWQKRKSVGCFHISSFLASMKFQDHDVSFLFICLFLKYQIFIFLSYFPTMTRVWVRSRKKCNQQVASFLSCSLTS